MWKLEALTELGWGIWAAIIGGIVLWGCYYSLQAKHTSVLIGYDGKTAYEIDKRDTDPTEWAMLKDGARVATLEETRNSPPGYEFKVKTSGINTLAAGMRVEIQVAGVPATMLTCMDCQRLNLPFIWTRKE